MTCQCTHTAQEKADRTDPAEPLVNYGRFVAYSDSDKQSTKEEKRIERRSGRFKQLKIAKYLTDSRDLCLCHSARIKGTGVSIGSNVAEDGREFAYFKGVQRCGKVHLCPVCSAKIRAGRAGELDTIMKGWMQDGGTCALSLLSLPHTKGDHIEDLLPFFVTGQKKGWNLKKNFIRKINQQGNFRRLKEELGIKFYCRTVESPYGSNGWHVHAHILWFINGKMTKKGLKTLNTYLFKAWSKHVQSYGRERPLPTYNKTEIVRDAEAMSKYLIKAALEMTRPNLKASAGISPFELLSRFDLAREYAVNRDTGEINEEYETLARELAGAWCEYAEGTKGMRALYISPELRKRYLKEEEKTDEELANEEAEGTVKEEVHLTDYEFQAVVSTGRQAEILTIMEKEGSEGVKREVARCVALVRKKRKQGALFPPRAQ